MLFDPDAGRSTEQIIMDKWNNEWSAEFKAQIERVHTSWTVPGSTWW
jgi:hypothetical protein